MAEVASYLHKLKFDPGLLDSFIAHYLKHARLVILFIIIILVLGVVSFLSIPRVLNPSINIAIVNVITVLPGAGPSDVESLITVPVEQAIGNVANIDTMTSTSQNATSIVTLQFLSGVDPDKAVNDVQTAIQSVSTLPKDATTPHVQKLDFVNTPVWTFAVTSSDPITLLRISRTIRDTLKDVNTLNTITTSGIDNQEVQVLIHPDMLSRFGINPQQLSQIVTTSINAHPAGNITTPMSSFSVTIDPVVTSVKDLRNLQIPLPDGTTILLSNVATVGIRPQPNSASSYAASKTLSTTPAVTFSVFKKSSANATTADQDAQDAVKKLLIQYPGRAHVATITDAGDSINRQFNELVRDLLITFVLVFIVIFVFLGTRQAIIAALAIPLTFLITFTVMHIVHIDLSFIAFFSLLLSLGLLVDDTIVVISALSAYHRSDKFTPLETGLLVWRDFKTAIFTTTLTTVWAFIPLLLSTGIIGEFIKPIPIVVSTALISSFVVAMFITLPLVIIILKPQVPRRVAIFLQIIIFLIICIFAFNVIPKGGLFLPAFLLFAITIFIYFQIRDILWGKTRVQFQKKTERVRKYFDKGLISFDAISSRYKRMLYSILTNETNRRKTLAMVVLFSIFSYILLPLGFVKNEFFPASAQEFFTITLELPAGTNSTQTEQEALHILNDIRNLPELQVAQLNVQSGGETSNGPTTNADNLASITVVLPAPTEQKISSIDVAQQVRDRYAHYQKGKISVVEASGGPPAGADVQIKLFGQDLAVLDSYAQKIKIYLSSEPGLTNIDTSIKSGTSKIVFIPDISKMSDAGVTQDQVGSALRSFVSGFTLDSNVLLEEGNTQRQDVVFRTDQATQTVNNLGKVTILTPKGTFSLISLGTITLKPNPTLITREAGKRTMSVTASVIKGYSISDKNAGLVKFANTLHLPSGYTWSTGGVNQQNQDSVTSILQAMVLSFLLIIITMVLQFSSFRKALIVMLVIPLSISGVFIVFSLTRIPLSFPALIGILALFGIVVKNSILIVDKINQNIKAGLEYTHAIIDASESRLEPIALTSFTAIVGLIPITLSNALWQGLGGAIIAGLIFSGSIMLFFIPVIYYYIFKSSEGKQKRK